MVGRANLQMRASLGATLAAALTLTGLRAEAQTDASEAARSLLVEQARVAGARGDHAEAASLAERALEIHSTASLRLFLAEQRIALGRDVEALAEVERCRREANPARPQEAPVRRNCEVLRRALVGRLAVVQLRVDPRGPSRASATSSCPPTEPPPPSSRESFRCVSPSTDM